VKNRFLKHKNNFSMDSLHKSSPTTTPTSFERQVRDSSHFVLPHPLPAIPPHHFVSPQQKQPRQGHVRRKLFIAFFILLLIVFLGATTFFLYKSFSIGHTIQFENSAKPSFFSDVKRLASSLIKTDAPPLRGEKEGRINILLLGRAGEHYPGRNLTDTIMILSIDTTNKKVSLLSLPRDLYAPIPETLLFIKINSLYQYGLDTGGGVTPLRESLETITGQTIHYSFILDFDGFEKVVDALHGISVDIIRDFYDPRYPGKNYSYETFEIKKGWQTLDGATALKYVRERHNDPEGDFGRAKRQQQVIQAIKDKAFSLGTFFNIFTVNSILTALGESVQTDMSLDDMEKFLSLIKKLDTKNATSIVVDAWKKKSLLRVSHIQVGSVAAFILVPRIGNWSEIRDVSENIFHLDTIKDRQNNIKKENASLTLLALPQDTDLAQKMKAYIMEEMGFEDVTIIYPNTLKNHPEKSMIADRTGLQKPYSLDELIKKFSLKKDGSSLLPQSDTSDFEITIGNDLADTFSFDDNLSSEVPEDVSFPEVLPPQENIRKE